jgi:hypothetical protein
MAQGDHRRRDQTRVSVARGQITQFKRRLEPRIAVQRPCLGGARSCLPMHFWCLSVPAANARERLALSQTQRPNVVQRFNSIQPFEQGARPGEATCAAHELFTQLSAR